MSNFSNDKKLNFVKPCKMTVFKLDFPKVSQMLTGYTN